MVSPGHNELKLNKLFQGLTYSIAQRPGESKTTSQASGLEQSSLYTQIEKMQILEVGQLKSFGNVKPCIHCAIGGYRYDTEKNTWSLG